MVFVLRVWVDVLTPKQLIFLGEIAEKLRKLGYDILFTTRRQREVLGLIDKLKFDFEVRVVGEYGKTLKEKLLASLKRMVELTEIVDSEKPDAAIAFGSPDAARVSFGLGIPFYAVNDTPHAYHVLRLSLPYTKLFFASKYIPIKAWLRHCISKKNIVLYDAIDQAAWLKNYKPNKETILELGLNERDTIITIRETEVFASYIITYYNKVSLAPTAETLVPKLLKEFPEAKIVIIPRYEDQIVYLKKKFLDERVVVVDKVVYGPDIIYYSALFIGGGGTMTGEAALLGVPAISFFPRGMLDVERFLMKKGILFRARNPEEIISLAQKLLRDEDLRQKIKNKSMKILRSMENPAEVVSRRVSEDLREPVS